jgi:hypothetical protein
MFMTSTNQIGIDGSRDYGTDVYPATFEPTCDAYAAASAPGETFYNAVSGDQSVKTVFKAIKNAEQISLPMSFFRTVVNQPSFANGSMCNHQVRMFNTSLSAAPYEPREVSGTVQLRLPMFKKEMEWKDVVGVQVDTAFIEQHLVSCENFRGFEYQDESSPTAVPAADLDPSQIGKSLFLPLFHPIVTNIAFRFCNKFISVAASDFEHFDRKLLDHTSQTDRSITKLCFSTSQRYSANSPRAIARSVSIESAAPTRQELVENAEENTS